MSFKSLTTVSTNRQWMVVVAFLVAVLLGAVSAIAADSDSDEPSDPLLDTLEWREVGPYRGGRSAAVAGIPDQRDVYYFGATGGGVWKTEDGGKTWNSVSDGTFGGSIGAVAVSAWDPNVIYVGTGEKTVRGNVSSGNGLWKSVDAGRTWKHIGLEDSRHIPRIRIHPKDPDRVYVASLGHLYGPNEQRGVFRSTDGGETWERILFVSPEAGAVDLVMDPTNPRILYASFWRVLRTPWSLESGGAGSGLWKSVDGGDTWTSISAKSAENGLPKGTWGISGIAVSPGDSDNLYALIEAEDGGVFRSRDGGESWEKTNDERSLRQRAWYYTRIYADPESVESVYVVNVRFHHSQDGGKSFRQIPTPHGDNHDLWIDPADPQRMVQANDGGANVSYDGGETWSVQSNQPTAQMYRVSTDNDFPYRLLGGQQDNSAVRIRSRAIGRSGIGERDWEPTAGGESGHIVAKPDDPDIVYGGSYGGFLTRVNHRTGERRAVNVWPDNPMGWGAAELKYRFQWNFPIFFSPHDPDRLYAAGNVLFASDDAGQTWTAMSPDLTRDDKEKMGPSGGPITKDNTSVEYYGTIFAVVESPLEEGVFWAGSDDGLLHLSRDGGETWTDVTPKRLPEWSLINSIEAHPFEPGGLYVAANRYKLDDNRPYLYKTVDWGKTWSRIDRMGGQGIDREHFTRVIRADPDRRGLLYVGTEAGVYVSLDDGDSWRSLQGNLPIVPITDLAVKEKDLVAATQGRGYWILDDLTSLHQATSETAEAPVHLFAPRATYRLGGGRGFGSPSGQGTNPPSGTVFRYLLTEEPAADAKVALEIMDSSGETIRRFTRKPAEDEKEDGGRGPRSGGEDLRQLPTEKGANRFVWNLRLAGFETLPKMILWNGRSAGPMVVAGEYSARLTVGEESQEVDFTIVADPRSSATAEDQQLQFDFLTSVRDAVNDTHEGIRRLRQIRDQLGGLKKKLGDRDGADAVVETAEDISTRLTTIEEALYQTKNRSRQDPLNFPIRLNDKLAGVYGLASIGDARPTESMIAVRDELTAAIEEQLAELRAIETDEIPEINRRVAEIGVPAVSVDDKNAKKGDKPAEPSGD